MEAAARVAQSAASFATSRRTTRLLALAAIYAHAPDGTVVSAALDHRDPYPLFEGLKRLVRLAEGLHGPQAAAELE